MPLFAPTSIKEQFLQLLQKSKLCVSTTNTTVFIETLSLNFPTVIFWNSNHSELRDEAIHFFKLLENAEILFHCPMQAAKKVNSISNKIDAWWFSEKVQSAKIKFCKKYSNKNINLSSEIKNIFKGIN